MNRFRMDRWLPAGSLVFAGLVLVSMGGLGTQSVATTAVFVTLLAVLAWWSWPGRRGSHVSHAEAQAAANEGDVIVYWRPG